MNITLLEFIKDEIIRACANNGIIGGLADQISRDTVEGLVENSDDLKIDLRETKVTVSIEILDLLEKGLSE